MSKTIQIEEPMRQQSEWDGLEMLTLWQCQKKNYLKLGSTYSTLTLVVWVTVRRLGDARDNN